MRTHVMYVVATFPLLLCILTTSGDAWGEDQKHVENREPMREEKASAMQIPVEYSNLPDEQASEECVHNGLFPRMGLFTQAWDDAGCPFPQNSFLYWPPSPSGVDALAGPRDDYLLEVEANVADLLVSFAGDMSNVAVYYESPSGVVGRLWHQASLCRAVGGGDGSVEDVDALEVWGPPTLWDACMFSISDAYDDWSVYVQADIGHDNDPYIMRSDIWEAIIPLGYKHHGVPDIELDALMVWDVDDDGIWNDGDKIIFSIQAQSNWDGGEIVVYPHGGQASFLLHGGHLWNTAFPVAATFAVNTEEVDAIEGAIVAEMFPVPSVSRWGVIIMSLLLLGTVTILIVRRRVHSGARA